MDKKVEKELYRMLDEAQENLRSEDVRIRMWAVEQVIRQSILVSDIDRVIDASKKLHEFAVAGWQTKKKRK